MRSKTLLSFVICVLFIALAVSIEIDLRAKYDMDYGV